MKEKINIKGIKVQKINMILMISGAVLTLLVFTLTFQVKSRYRAVIASATDYADCSKAIEEMRIASDFMTNQVNFFSINLAPVFMTSYFTEKDIYRRRETSVEIIEFTHKNDSIDLNIKSAKKESDALIKFEYLIMKLLCESSKIPEELIPEAIINFELEENYRRLSAREKLEAAHSLLFNAEYVASKARLNRYIHEAHSDLTSQYMNAKQNGDQVIRSMLSILILFVALLFAVCVFLYFHLVTLVLRPLFKNLEAIQNGTKMKLNGSYEIKYLASSYNSLCERNEIRASVLRHKAEHDSLTGLINREGFEIIKAELSSPESIAYLLIDIDFFKDVNDCYGHKTGDDVLKKVAELLTSQFRKTDYIARLGGDEFAVIMTKFGKSIKNIIQEKVDNLNKILRSGVDGLPVVSVSVGVAFSEVGYNESLMEKADKALYRVKNNGRANCSFYFEGDD